MGLEKRVSIGSPSWAALFGRCYAIGLTGSRSVLLSSRKKVKWHSIFAPLVHPGGSTGPFALRITGGLAGHGPPEGLGEVREGSLR